MKDVLLNPDFLILAALVVAMAVLVAVVTTTPSGAWPRYVRGRRYHRDGLARHARRPADDEATVTVPALETMPDVVSPFAARTA